MRADATARTTRSSLKGRRSSKLPPPRARTTTSTSGCSVERAQRGDDRAGGALALDARLADDDPRPGEAGADRRDEVAAGGGVRTREDPDRARKARQRALALGREEALRGELPLQLLERDEVRSDPEALHGRRAQAELALLLVELGASGDVHGLALRRGGVSSRS